MSYNGNDGHRYSGIGRGNLRISLSSKRGARSIPSEEMELDAESCYIAGLPLEEFPPIQQPSTSRNAASIAPSKLEHGGYGSDGIKTYFQNSPYKYPGHGRGSGMSRPGARSTYLRQSTLSTDADEENATGGYGSEGIKISGPVVPRGGLQAACQPSLETGQKQESSESSLDSNLGE